MPRHHDTRQTLYDAPVRVWDETPSEAEERRAAFEANRAAHDRADDLREAEALARAAENEADHRKDAA